MKSRYTLLFSLLLVAGCHGTPTAVSADGAKIHAGQVVHATRHAIGCMSHGDLKDALAHRSAGEKSALYQMFKSQKCGFFESNERLNVKSVDMEDQSLEVSSMDDSNAPGSIWVMASQVATGQ